MTIVKGLKYSGGIGGMESVTELHVDIEGKDYFALLTDMGEYQRVLIFEEPAIDKYGELIKMDNAEFEKEHEKFTSKAIYSEDKEMSEWYFVNEKKFDATIKLAAMASEAWPGGLEDNKFAESADGFIAEYIEQDIDEINLPETYQDLDDEE